MKKDNRYLKDNGKWTEGRINRIINNPIYMGDLVWGQYKRKPEDRMYISNHSPAIISREIWEKCQDQLDKNKHGNYGKNIHIFHRIIRCPECHELMNSFYTLKHRNKKIIYNYYVRCLNKNCSKRNISYNANKIEKELIGVLNDLSGIALLSSYSLNFPSNDNKCDIDKIKGSITKLKNDENKLLELLLNNKLDSDLLISKLQSVSSEKKKLSDKKQRLENDICLNYNNDLVKLYNNKDIGEIKGINPIWNILSRDGKKEVISTFIKYIDISTDKDYNVKIENIVFNNEFLQNKFYNIPKFLIDKFKEEYKDIMFDGICTKEQFKKSNLYKNNEYYSFNELTKYYTQSRKSLEPILSKFKNCNLRLLLLIDNNQYIDAIITFDSVK